MVGLGAARIDLDGSATGSERFATLAGASQEVSQAQRQPGIAGVGPHEGAVAAHGLAQLAQGGLRGCQPLGDLREVGTAPQSLLEMSESLPGAASVPQRLGEGHQGLQRLMVGADRTLQEGHGILWTAHAIVQEPQVGQRYGILAVLLQRSLVESGRLAEVRGAIEGHPEHLPGLFRLGMLLHQPAEGTPRGRRVAFREILPGCGQGLVGVQRLLGLGWLLRLRRFLGRLLVHSRRGNGRAGLISGISGLGLWLGLWLFGPCQALGRLRDGRAGLAEGGHQSVELGGAVVGHLPPAQGPRCRRPGRGSGLRCFGRGLAAQLGQTLLRPLQAPARPDAVRLQSHGALQVLDGVAGVVLEPPQPEPGVEGVGGEGRGLEQQGASLAALALPGGRDPLLHHAPGLLIHGRAAASLVRTHSRLPGDGLTNRPGPSLIYDVGRTGCRIRTRRSSWRYRAPPCTC